MRVPLSQLVGDLAVPSFLSEPLEAAEVVDFDIDLASSQLWMTTELSNDEAQLPLGEEQHFSLRLDVASRVGVQWGDEPAVVVETPKVTIRLPEPLSRATKNDTGRWIAAETPSELSFSATGGMLLKWTDAGLSILEKTSGMVSVGATLPPTAIGDTGFVFSAEDVVVSSNQRGEPVFELGRVLVHFPDDIPIVPDVEILGARITSTGFTGNANLQWDLEYSSSQGRFVGDAALDLFGFTAGIRRFAVDVENNVVAAWELGGGIKVPFFDAAPPVEIKVGLAEGGFELWLAAFGDEGLLLRQEELLELEVRALGFSAQDATLGISGGLTPLLMSTDGLEWPTLSVEDLSINREGRITFREAWLDLNELATLDLWGFQLELSRLGIGNEEPRNRMWVDLSGSLKLIDAVPLGVGVDGFRISWPGDIHEQLGIVGVPSFDEALAIAEQFEVSLDDIYLFYGVPEVVEFEGYIGLFKEAQKAGFRGGMGLRVPAAGFSLDADLLIGMNNGEPPYPFLYLAVGVELPVGIPLAQSGLALKGAAGLLGINVTPDKKPGENWYHDWYKRPKEGAIDARKWRDEYLAFALGFGVNISTVDGYLEATRGLLVLAVPGPILVIEGKATILEGLLPFELPFQALAIIDGREKIIQFNIEMEAEIVEDMLEAYAMLEAFFDFDDLTNWHLFLGQDEPRERRIRADFLKWKGGFLFSADAYFMIDMIGSHTLRIRMGVFVGFRPNIPKFGPVEIDFHATIDGNALVTLLPEQIGGSLALSAGVTVMAFGFGLRFAASASVGGEASRPLRVATKLSFVAEIPLPLAPVEHFLEDLFDVELPDVPPLEIEVELDLEWTTPKLPKVKSPLAEITVGSRMVSGSSSLKLYKKADVGSDSWKKRAQAAPVVAVDARPILAFTHQMKDVSLPFGRHPDGGPSPMDGPIEVTPSLTKVRLYEHRKGQGWEQENWRLIASTDDDGENRLPGIWVADADPGTPESPPSRRLQLLSNNPFRHASFSIGAGYSQLLGSLPAGLSFADRFLRDHPGYMVPIKREQTKECVDFDEALARGLAPNTEWLHEGLAFGIEDKGTAVRDFEKETTLWLWDSIRTWPLLERWDGLGRLVAATTGWLDRVTRPVRRALNLTFNERCLFVPLGIEIRFPEPVMKVWIRFCELPDMGLHQDSIDLSRAPKTAHERSRVREAAAASGRETDYEQCAVEIEWGGSADGKTWEIRGEEAFECLSFRGLGPFAIREICWMTAEDLEEEQQQEVAEDQADANNNLPPEMLLRPGSHYCLRVYTEQSAELVFDPDDGDPRPPEERFIFPSAEEKQAFFAGLSRLKNGIEYVREGFFQTEAPPTNIRPYVKWTHPEPQAPRVFRDDILSVRFLRPSLRDMFGDLSYSPHALSLQVKGVDGRLVPGWNRTQLRDAGSSTLFPEEAAWFNWLETHDELSGMRTEPPKDSLLSLRRDLGSSSPLEPGTRYSLLLMGGEGGGTLPLQWPSLPSRWHLDEGTGELEREALAAKRFITAGDSTWTDIDFAVELKTDADREIGVLVRAMGSQSVDGADATTTAYLVSIKPGTNQCQVEIVTWESWGVFESREDVISELNYDGTSTPVQTPADDWTRLRVRVVSDSLQAWVFDKEVLNVRLQDPNGLNRTLLEGNVGVYAQGNGRFRSARVRNAILHSVSFTTSAFEGFEELVTWHPDGEPLEVQLARASATSIDLGAFQDAEAALASARWQWHRDQVDFRFEKLIGGREALEASRLVLREARAVLDEAFRAVAQGVSDLTYRPIATDFEAFALIDDSDELVAFWIRSPEGLDLQVPVEGADQSVGRTALRLKKNGQLLAFQLVHDSDDTQLIMMPGAGSTWARGAYELEFQYTRDHGDESGTEDHTYDRPIQKRQTGAQETIVVPLEVPE